MNGAYMAVTAASLTAGLAVFYAHYNQISERDRMHQGVLRDIAKEELEKQQLMLKSSSSTISNQSINNLTPSLLSSSIPSSNLSVIPSSTLNTTTTTISNTIDNNNANCDTGICDLSQRRIRPTGESDITHHRTVSSSLK